MDRNKKIAAQKIENVDDAVTFMLQYSKLEIREHEKELRDLIGFLEQFSFHKFIREHKHYVHKDGQIFRADTIGREEYRDRIESLEKFQKRIQDWHDKPVADALQKFSGHIDELIATYQGAMPESARGNRKKPDFLLLASSVKGFWTEALGHKKFYYHDLKPDDDYANDFVNDLVLALFRGTEIKKIRGLKQAFRRLSDSKKKRLETSTEK